METQVNQVALPLRSHTILGVCEAIGEDFGFNPVLLRIPFAASVIYSPTMAIAAYFALGLVVLASRLLFPSRGVDGHLTRVRLFQLLRDLALRAGIDPARISPHVLRHAFAEAAFARHAAPWLGTLISPVAPWRNRSRRTR